MGQLNTKIPEMREKNSENGDKIETRLKVKQMEVKNVRRDWGVSYKVFPFYESR